MFTFPWWSWALLAVLVAVAELHAPGSYFIWIALGAAVTTLVDAIIGLSFTEQIATFVVASAISCAGGYFVYRKRHPSMGESDENLNQRSLRMVGAKGFTCETFSNGCGKVRLGDSVWLAEGPDLPEGAAIIVTSVRGARLIVHATAGERRID